jgi:hypothetical protein
MIKEEDCCDNCEEGIEPCCDEELAEHIEEQLNEQIEPEQPTEFVPEVKAKNRLADDLAKHLCCQNKFYIIIKAMADLNEKELTKLRDDLRNFTKTNQLHPQLESKFRHALAKSN